MSDLILVICFLINFILSFVFLKDKNIPNRCGIAVSIIILDLFIGAIISALSMVLADTVGKINMIATDKQFLLGCNVSMFMTPFFAYYINKKKSITNKKFILNIVLIIIGFVILTTSVFIIVLNTNAWKNVDYLYDIYDTH